MVNKLDGILLKKMTGAIEGYKSGRPISVGEDDESKEGEDLFEKSNLVADLEGLNKLFKDGVLSQEEFDAAKSKLLKSE
jgi:hypothetical protein